MYVKSKMVKNKLKIVEKVNMLSIQSAGLFKIGEFHSCIIFLNFD